MTLLLDTNALVWLVEGRSRLGRKARGAIERARRKDDVCCSAFSFLELALLIARGRLRLTLELPEWRADVLDAGIWEIAVSGEIAMLAGGLDALADPADRIVMATSILMNARIVTADQAILAYRGSPGAIDATN